jgi:hypothetical protein
MTDWSKKQRLLRPHRDGTVRYLVSISIENDSLTVRWSDDINRAIVFSHQGRATCARDLCLTVSSPAAIPYFQDAE